MCDFCTYSVSLWIGDFAGDLDVDAGRVAIDFLHLKFGHGGIIRVGVTVERVKNGLRHIVGVRLFGVPLSHEGGGFSLAGAFRDGEFCGDLHREGNAGREFSAANL